MKKEFMVSAVLAVVFAVPCAAQFNDEASALTALNGATAKERLAAINYLGPLRTQAAYEALCARFKIEKDAYLRVQIVEAFDVQASTLAYSCALAAADDTNRAVRVAVPRVLASKAGDAEANKRLSALAADPADAVRVSVVSSLAVEASTSSVAIIGGVLADHKGNIRVRRAAAAALAGIKNDAADAELLKHLSDADAQIKASAMSRRGAKAKQQK